MGTFVDLWSRQAGAARDDDKDKNTRRWSVRLVMRQRVRGILPAVTILQCIAVDPWMTMTKRAQQPDEYGRQAAYELMGRRLELLPVIGDRRAQVWVDNFEATDADAFEVSLRTDVRWMDGTAIEQRGEAMMFEGGGSGMFSTIEVARIKDGKSRFDKQG
ncbi:hypothetical protein BDN67DRAFT_982605 [Paxillus ammoniavirescens]|nr:hypothetical protein BDN67DRAFT_982605 [Paxillus ammoniavirescens]